MASNGARRAGSNRFLPPDPRVEGPYRFTPQLALRIGIIGAVALRCSACSSSGSGRCRCSPGRSTCRPRSTTSCARCASRRRAGRSSTARAASSSRTSRAPPSQLCPADLPKTWAAWLDELKRLSKVAARARCPDAARDQAPRQRPDHAGDRQRVGQPQTRRSTTCSSTARSSRASASPTRSSAATRTARCAAHVLGYVNEISPEQLKQLQQQGLRGGRQDRRGRRRGELRLVPARPGRASRSSASTRSAGRAASSS